MFRASAIVRTGVSAPRCIAPCCLPTVCRFSVRAILHNNEYQHENCYIAPTMDSLLTIQVIPISIGSGILLAAGIILWQRAYTLLADGVRTRAIVVGYQEVYNRNHKFSPTYAPIIEFTTREGKRIHTTLHWSSNPPKYRKGTAINVLYTPTSPTTVDVDSVFKLVVLPRSLTAIGIVGLLYGIVQFAEFCRTP